MAANKNKILISDDPDKNCEITDDAIENVVGGIGALSFDLDDILGNRVGRPGSTTVSKCPVCGAQESTFDVLSVSELKYQCPCGAILKYNTSSKSFYKV